MRHVVFALALAAPALAAAQDAPTFDVQDNALVVPAPVTFETGSAALTGESGAAIQHVAAYLAAKDYVSTLRVEVHSDAMGSEAANQATSEARALAVARALVAAGVDCKRLLPVGFGETKPVAPNDTAEGRALNRRVVFVNAGLRGRAIGGMPMDGGGRVAGDPCT